MEHIFLVFACFSGLMVFGQPVLPPEVMANIEQRIEAGMNPSVAIGIYDHGETRYFCFGKTRTGGSAVDEHTIYEIGSVSKTFTATLLADAALKGRVSIDSPAQKYLPRSVRLPTYEGRQITLGELSDHTSSLPRMPDNFNPADSSELPSFITAPCRSIRVC